VKRNACGTAEEFAGPVSLMARLKAALGTAVLADGRSAAAFAAVPSRPSPAKAILADAAHSASRFVMFSIEPLLGSSG
jgi:hypothetical protein